MRFDEYGLLVTSEAPPGCYGDSCAETARYSLLINLITPPTGLPLNLYRFITKRGIQRHPWSPWREDDTSEDQKLPLFLALHAVNHPDLENYKKFDPFWKLKLFVGIRTFVQALFFKLPYRWDDGHQRPQKTSESSCDYLNFFAMLAYATITKKHNFLTRGAMRLVPPDILSEKIRQYYHKPEDKWLAFRYDNAIDIVYFSVDWKL